MSTIAKTLKLPFLRLNRAKAEELTHLQALNTSAANAILVRPGAWNPRTSGWGGCQLTSQTCSAPAGRHKFHPSNFQHGSILESSAGGPMLNLNVPAQESLFKEHASPER